MKRDNLSYLLGGLAFGFLIGYGVFHAVANRPDAQTRGEASGVPAPAGPMAATQVGPPSAGAGAGAPMVAEINELKRVLQADPDNLEVVTRLAHLYHDVSMWPQAAQYYEKAITLAPNDPDLLTDLGVCFQEQGQFEEAMGLFKRAQEADASHWQSLYNQVVVGAFRLDRVEEAEKALDRLEKIQPSLPQLPQLRQAVEQVRSRKSGAAPS